MKQIRHEEMEDQDHEFDSSEWQGRSEDNVNNNHRIGGCLFIVFLICLVWFGFYKLFAFLSLNIQL